jgi:hypothetical protein
VFERRADQRLPLDDLSCEGARRGDDDSVLPPEEDHARENEDKRERDGAEIVLLERNRLQLGKEGEGKEEKDREPLTGAWRLECDACRRSGHDRNSERERARYQKSQPERVAGQQCLVRHAMRCFVLSLDGALGPAPTSSRSNDEGRDAREYDHEPRPTSLPFEHAHSLLSW